MIDGDFDAAVSADGIVEVTIRGVWSAPQVDRFFATIAPLREEARRRRQAVLTLAIIESVQSPVVAAQVRSHVLSAKKPGDRNAFVVASQLSKFQIKRLASWNGFGLFTDEATARRWLLDSR